jgi:ankyrin repeat protein
MPAEGVSSRTGVSAKKRFQQLLQAYHLNDLATLEALLEAGVEPDAGRVDDGGDTLLMRAVRQGRREAVQLLLGHGASAVLANRAGETARGLGEAARDRAIAGLFATAEPIAAASVRLFQAIERIGRGVPARAVLEHVAGADLALRQGGRTPLLALATVGARGPEVYAALLAAGADAAAADDSGNTALHHLAYHGLADEARALLDAAAGAAPLNAPNALGSTALHVAATYGADRVVTLLLDRGARGDLRDGIGRTALELSSGRVQEILMDRPGISLRGDLELALRARWDLGDLAIYADQLQLEGDPRGELIMLDLAPDPRSSKWRDRRLALLDDWLGKDLARRAHQLVRYGFVPYLHDRGGASFGRRSGQSRLAAELLDSPAGRYVRSFATSGGPERVIASLRRLASQPRPHLAELAIALPDSTRVRVHDELIDALIAATPSLRALYILDALPFPRFPHPAVRRCIAAGQLGGLATTRPHSVEARDLEVLLEAIDTGTDVRGLFPDLDARLAELERAAIVDDARALTALGRAILDGGLVQTLAGTWLPARR